MRISRLILLLVPVGLASAEVALTDAQWKGLVLQFAAKLEPPGGASGSRINGAVRTGRDAAHRLIFDASERRYFGYDLDIQPLPDALRVRIAPLSLTAPELAESGVDPSWNKLTPLRYPLIPEVRSGDTIAIDLMVNPSTGQKIVDYITVRRSTVTSGVVSSPRDFTAADAILRVISPSLSMNGKLLGTYPAGAGISAAAVWFYQPGKGRYILSLAPNLKLGFRKAGRASQNTLLFSDESATYQIECPARIVPGEGVFNLYMFHDATWRPTGAEPQEPFLLGGADQADLLVHK